MRTQTVVTLAGIAAGLYFFNKMKNSAAQVAAQASPPVSGMTGTGSAFPLGCGSVSVNGSYLDGVYPDLGLGRPLYRRIVHDAAAPIAAAKSGKPLDVMRGLTAVMLPGVAPLVDKKLRPVVSKTFNLGPKKAPVSAQGIGPQSGSPGPGGAGAPGLDVNGYPVGQQYTDAAGNPITAQQYYDSMHQTNSGGSGSGTENSGGSSGGGSSSGGATPYNSSDWSNADGSTVSQPSSDDSMYPSDTSAPAAPVNPGPGVMNPSMYADPSTTDLTTAPDVQQGSNYGTLIAGGAAIAAAYFLTK